MAGNQLDVVVRFIGDATSAVNAANKTESAYTQAGNKMVSVGAKMSLALTLPLAAAGVAAFKEFESAGKVAAQTNAVIKSTGGVANVTAKEVDGLAQSLLKKSGTDDEAIKSSENLLLTFTNVRNEAGKGNDIFNQATTAALDLSVAFGKDLESSALTVGKALNNPAEGLTKLQKIGVQFTAQQKEQVKAMQAAGDTMGAQKIILAELTREVGGSAEAYGNTLAGRVSKAKEELLNAGASIVAVAAPAFEVLASAASKLAGFLSSLPAPVQAAIGGFAIFAAALGPALTIIGNIVKVSGAVASGFQTMALKAMYAADAIKLMGAQSLVALGGFALLFAAVAAFVIYASMSASASERAAESGKKWAEVQVENAKASNNQAQTLAQLAPQLKGVDAALKDSIDMRERYSEVQQNNAAAMEQFGISSTEAQQRVQQMTPTISKLQAEHDVLAKAVAEAKRQLELQAAATKAQQQANDQLAAAAQGVSQATNEQIQAIQQLNNAYLAAQGGELGYNAAQMQVESAQIKVNDAVAKFGPDSLEARQAANDLAQAKLSAANAAFTLQANEGTLANVLKTQGVGGLTTLRDSLLQTIRTHGDASGAVQVQVDKINALIATAGKVPPDKTMKLNADTAKGEQDIARFTAAAVEAAKPRTAVITAAKAGESIGWGGYAKGGVVPGPKGAPQFAVVHGGETIIPVGASTGPTGTSGFTGPVINVNVNVSGLGADVPSIQRAVVESIRGYVDRNGPIAGISR